MSQTEQFVSYKINDGIGTVTLDREPANVLHIPMLQQIGGIVWTLSQNTDVRVLILKAKGKMFSAGVDIADHTAEKVGQMIPLFNNVCRTLVEFPVPTIAAIHGHALGGGCELVLCCDLAVMSDMAKIGQPEIQLAAFAPIAAMRLPQLVGLRAAADILLTGRNLTADEALKIGLVNAVMPSGEVEEWAQDKAFHIAKLSRAAMMLNKRALRIGFGEWDNIFYMEQMYLGELMNTADAHEGLAAFTEKRPPKWKHE